MDEYDFLCEAVTAYQTYNSKRAAAKALGIPRTTIQSRLHKAARLGLMGTAPVLPGFQIKKTSAQIVDGVIQKEWVQQTPAHGESFEVPQGHYVKGVSALIDAEGQTIQQWVKTKNDNEIDWVELLKNAFKDYKGRARPIKPPPHAKKDHLNFFPMNDWHINMLAWSREVGESWDLQIAEKVIGDAIETAISRTKGAAIAIVLGGGDLMHNDDNANRTAKSGNVLDADGRHQKGIEVAQRLKVRTIEASLQYNDKVVVRILKGNHDEYSSVAIAHFLSAWFRNESRVTVDLDASLFWWYRFGSVMLGATHGHTVKMHQMPSIMAHRRAEDWGKTKFRYVHGFHIHHREKLATEGEGVICESHQAPIPMDSWHCGSGYLSGRSVQTITYHKDFGEVSRAREAIIDAT